MAYWRLAVSFEELAAQAEKEPQHAFPNDDVSRTIAFVCEEWGLSPEDLQQIARWTDTEITIESDVIDAFDELLSHLVMHTVPVKIVVEREQG